MSQLLKLTGQDWQFDDTNNEIDILDHKGSSTSVGILNDGVDIDQITYIEDEYNSISKVTVLGKSGTSGIISGTYSSGWSQGDPEITIVDRSIDTVAEAEDRAEQEYNARNGTDNTYTFRMLNSAFSFEVGDVVTINSQAVGLSDTNVRITSRKWVVVPGKRSQLYLEVRSTTAREAARDRLSVEQARRRAMDDANSMEQSTTAASSSTSVSGSVNFDVIHDTSSYSTGTYEDTGITGDNSWKTCSDSYTVGPYYYLFHAVYGTLRLDLDAGTGHSWACAIYVRLHNVDTGESWPDPYMIINSGFSKDGIDTVIVPFLIVAPERWNGDEVVLQYKIQNETYWSGGTQSVTYQYWGIASHSHGDTFDTTDANHDGHNING